MGYSLIFFLRNNQTCLVAVLVVGVVRLVARGLAIRESSVGDGLGECLGDSHRAVVSGVAIFAIAIVPTYKEAVIMVAPPSPPSIFRNLKLRSPPPIGDYVIEVMKGVDV